METTNHTDVVGGHCESGIHGKEHAGEVAGVGLECVFAVEDGETFVIGAPGS